MQWLPPKIGDADSWTETCIGCNEYQVEEVQLGDGDEAMQSLGKVVHFHTATGNTLFLCMTCLDELHCRAHQEGLVGGANGL